MPWFRDLGGGPSEEIQLVVVVAYKEVEMLDSASKDERRFDSCVADSLNEE